MASTTINDFYSTGIGEKDITLKISIENAQIAKTTVRLNNQLIAVKDDSFEISIGKAKEIVGKVLYIDTTETDIDPYNNYLSFKLELFGGPNNYINQRGQTVQQGGFVQYNGEIVLIP